jgi:hypothetical protein
LKRLLRKESALDLAVVRIGFLHSSSAARKRHEKSKQVGSSRKHEDKKSNTRKRRMTRRQGMLKPDQEHVIASQLQRDRKIVRLTNCKLFDLFICNVKTTREKPVAQEEWGFTSSEVYFRFSTSPMVQDCRHAKRRGDDDLTGYVCICTRKRPANRFLTAPPKPYIHV